jgi:hypothetical protein
VAAAPDPAAEAGVDAVMAKSIDVVVARATAARAQPRPPDVGVIMNSPPKNLTDPLSPSEIAMRQLPTASRQKLFGRLGRIDQAVDFDQAGGRISAEIDAKTPFTKRPDSSVE